MTARAVAFETDLIAVADGDAGLAIIDISDPPAAQILHQLSFAGTAQAVVVANDIAYIGLTSGNVVAVDMVTGAKLQRLI